MHSGVLYLAVTCLAVLPGVLAFVVVRARSKGARTLAADTLTFNLSVLLVLVSHAARPPYYLDAALALVLLSFVSTLAAGRCWWLGRLF